MKQLQKRKPLGRIRLLSEPGEPLTQTGSAEEETDGGTGLCAAGLAGEGGVNWGCNDTQKSRFGTYLGL